MQLDAGAGQALMEPDRLYDISTFTFCPAHSPLGVHGITYLRLKAAIAYVRGGSSQGCENHTDSRDAAR